MSWQTLQTMLVGWLLINAAVCLVAGVALDLAGRRAERREAQRRAEAAIERAQARAAALRRYHAEHGR